MTEFDDIIKLELVEKAKRQVAEDLREDAKQHREFLQSTLRWTLSLIGLGATAAVTVALILLDENLEDISASAQLKAEAVAKVKVETFLGQEGMTKLIRKIIGDEKTEAVKGFNETLTAERRRAVENLDTQLRDAVQAALAMGPGTDLTAAIERAAQSLKSDTPRSLVSQLNTPIGTVVAFAGDAKRFSYLSTLGWLPCDGRPLRTSDDGDGPYDRLFDVIGTSFGTGEDPTGLLSGNFNLPDYRGYFLRGSSPDDSVDPDGPRAPTSREQGDAFRSHKHDFNKGVQLNSVHYADGSLSSTHILQRTDDPTRAVAITSAGGSETRPRNMAVHWLIKAFAAQEPAEESDEG